ncbi:MULTISPECIES: DUF2486 family protein [Caballeronia]|uniref:DUF2486 family protein n=1 Tax=Caballeronia TaxID=1827195 RepID=UPI0002389060|nr:MULTISPECIES: DUF2486 family protein [unclassified Caballeronia]AET88424.1 hypothetical protein BYI23_A005860 [Burkholderia sp. YI23]BAO85636.1 putative uncharacterized protein [Burkholderia sp. RPE67]BBP95471.1 hypothetical protein BSFA1_06000 [Burkholderia sp. SFA1]MCE4542634.1 DUF2486 family protein [Caballeronia sp. PC1]MCE4568310.1 DUF2486 family protein [Caballeronia sp. CLC5]
MTDKPDSFDPSIPVLTDVVVPGKPEYARAPSVDEAAIEYDAEQIADRLRGRFTNFLTGEARALIEERCREVLREHSSQLVSAITREVAMALEGRMSEWVREAVEKELRRQRGE